jgi:hypothetical protein
MPSVSIDSARKRHPGKTDEEVAVALAEEGGYVIVVRYRLSPDGPYSNLGLCRSYAEADDSYLFNESLYDVDVVYDRRRAGPPDKVLHDAQAVKRRITFREDGYATEPCCWNCMHFSISLSGTQLCCRDALGRGVVQVDRGDKCVFWQQRR